MARFGPLNFAQKNCLAAAGKLMQTTGQLTPGARVGVAVSGGVDSMTLLKVLSLRRRIVPFPFELMALHVNAGFDPRSHEPLLTYATSLGVASHAEVTTFGPDAHSDKNRKGSACFYCAWHRRKLLFQLCRRYRLSHLAFGHTAQDLVTNFFMNIFQNGHVGGMSAREPFFGGELTVIRPLLLLDKPVIQRAAKAWGLPIVKNDCPSSGDTLRSETYAWLEERWRQGPKRRNAVYNAITRWQMEADKAEEDA